MTFSMLPVFAAADDAVSEVAAVEAPTAEAPVAEVPAVEDVAEIPAELPAAVPVVEAIETVATETVATLQEGLSADDTAAIEAGKVFKIIAPDGEVTYVSGLSSALTTACAWTTTGGSVTMLTDYVYLSADSSAASSGVFNWKYSPTYQTTDADGLTVNGFWLDLGGNTLTARRGGPMISASVSSTYPAPWVNIRNGHVIHLNLLKDGSAGRGAVVNGTINYGTTSTAPASADAVYQTHTTLKDVDIVTVDYSTSTSKVMKGYASSVWNNTIRLYDSKILTHNTYGVHFYKSTYSVSDAAALELLKTHGSNNILELHGNSVVGNYSNESYAVFYGANKSSTHAGIAHNVTITADKESMFIGGTLFGQTNQDALDEKGNPTYTEEQKYPVNVSLPAGHIGNATFKYAVPSKSNLPAATGYGEAAYYDRGTEKEYAAMRFCSGTTVEHVEAKAATFSEEGYVEHWRCADCGACYSDSTLTTFVDPADIATPVRALTDTEGLVTDEDFAKLGAVAITIDPDGTKIAYTGSSAIKDAYTYGANTWTTSGGVVRLVCDFTYAHGSYTTAGTGLFDSAARTKATNKSWQYTNKDDENLKGFWFDLGGHTLVTRTGYALFGPAESLPVNIRNGNIIYQNTAANTSNYGCFKNGTTSPDISTAAEVHRPVYTFNDVTFIRVPKAKQTDFNSSKTPASGPIFIVALHQSEINLIDSTVINADGGSVATYSKSSKTMTCTAEGVSKAYKHVVNLKGDTVVGKTNGVAFTCSSAGDEIPGDPDSITIHADESVTFLGTDIATISNAALAANSSVPTGYVQSAATFDFNMPDMTTAAKAITAGAGVDYERDGNGNFLYTPIPMLEKQSDDTVCATFTPNGGEAGEAMTLSAAIKAWEANNFSGTITLTNDLAAEDAAKAIAALGCSGTFAREYDSGSTIQIATPALYTVTSKANNGDLTVDLGNNTLALDAALLILDEALENFDLTIKNGTISDSCTAPVLILKGKGGTFKLEGVTVENTNETANFPYALHDTRYAGASSLLTDSTLTSAHGSAVVFMTTSANSADAALFTYMKDCTLSGVKYGEYSPATIAKLSSLSSREYRPAVGVILENTTLNGETATNLNSSELVAIGAAADEIAAKVMLGSLMTLDLANVSDAVKCAEFFGRISEEPARVTLLADAEVTESVPVGTAGLESTITLDLNGKALKGVGLIEANGGDGTKVTLNVVGTLGGDTAKMNLFAHAPALDYEEGNSYVIEKGRYFTKYSLNLEDTISINLYTDGENGTADSVCYVQDGKDYTAVAGELNEWVVTTLAARDMGKTISAYAVKNEGAVTYIDFVKGVSVKGYAASDPGSSESEAAIAEALNKTLDTMLVYGEYAKKYFAYDYTEISNMSSLIGKDAPAVDTTNLTHTERKVTGIPNRAEDSTLTECFWGTSAVLESSIGIKFYFSGKMFDGVSAKVKYGNGDFVDAELVAQGTSDFKTLMVGLSAKDFDTEVTVKLLDAENNEIGTVVDSVEAYTSRVGENENSYRLAQALRAYGADAKRYYEAKYGN
ncbi:MAG: hypothetical protein IKC04_02980, partial [Oscillospiraceae bacterium]|nr:hypothetical protein [Oscillospiraceae bacterium]